MDIEKIFNYARENKISDIHLLEGDKIYFRKDGKIIEYDSYITVTKDELLEICKFSKADIKNLLSSSFIIQYFFNSP